MTASLMTGLSLAVRGGGGGHGKRAGQWAGGEVFFASCSFVL